MRKENETKIARPEAWNGAESPTGLPRDVAESFCTHFVAFRGEEWWSAVKVWGIPDFVHAGWDRRAAREIADGDTIVFATGSEADEPRSRNWSDYIEVEND